MYDYGLGVIDSYEVVWSPAPEEVKGFLENSVIGRTCQP